MLPAAHETTSSALRPDGRRETIVPLDVRGRFIRARRVVFTIPMGIYGAIPFVVVGGHPAVHLDVQGRRFDPAALKVQQSGDKWTVAENGRPLFDCATPDEGETLIRVVKAFGFDQLCHLGPSQKLGVSFFAKGK